MIGWISLALCCLAGVFIWGKAVGSKRGQQAMTAYLPLKLRQESFEKGYCILCHRMFRYKTRSLKKSVKNFSE